MLEKMHQDNVIGRKSRIVTAGVIAGQRRMVEQARVRSSPHPCDTQHRPNLSSAMGWPACLLAFYASATRLSFPTIVDAHPICSSELLFAYFIASFSVCLALSVIAHVVDVSLTSVPDYDAVMSSKVVRKARSFALVVHSYSDAVSSGSPRIRLPLDRSPLRVWVFFSHRPRKFCLSSPARQGNVEELHSCRHTCRLHGLSIRRPSSSCQVGYLPGTNSHNLGRNTLTGCDFYDSLGLRFLCLLDRGTIMGSSGCACFDSYSIGMGGCGWDISGEFASILFKCTTALFNGAQIVSEEIHQAFRRLREHCAHYHITHPSVSSPSTSTTGTTTVALCPRDLQVTAMMRARATYRVLQRLVSVCAYYRNTIRPVSSTIRLRILVDHYSQLHVTVLVAGAVHSSFIITEDAYIFTRSDRTRVLDVGWHSQDAVHFSPDWSPVSTGHNMGDSTDSDARASSYPSVLRFLAERRRKDDPALLDADTNIPRDLGVSRTDAYTRPLVSVRASAPRLFDLPTPAFSSTSAFKPTPGGLLLLPSDRPYCAAVLPHASADSDLDTHDLDVSQSTAAARRLPALVLPSSSASPLASSSLDLAPSFKSLKLPVSLTARSNSWSAFSDSQSPGPAHARIEGEDPDPCSSPQSDPEENDAAADGRKARRGKRQPTTVRQWRKRERRRLARAETEVELERARVEYYYSEGADDWDTDPDGECEREGFAQTAAAATSVC